MAYERDVCPRCGNLRSICSDPERDWHPNMTVCYADAATSWGERRLKEKWGEKTAEDGASPLDGIGIFATEHPPPDDPFA